LATAFVGKITMWPGWPYTAISVPASSLTTAHSRPVRLIRCAPAWALLHGGPAFVRLVRIHRWSTYLLTPVPLGHILIASGVLPGYRGVWRSMHFGGRLDRDVARRIWPAWLARNTHDDEP
jgi:formate dehydrogenase subunit gamma